MRQARQGIIHALRGERGQWPCRRDDVGAVDDIVVGGAQVGHVEHIAQGEIRRALLRDADGGILATAKCTGSACLDYRS